MLLKLSGHIASCLERATNAEQRALQAADSAIRSDNELLAQSWRHLARSYQFVESLEQFLAETARGRTEIMPEAPVIMPEPAVQETPPALEPRPIIRRRRVKHEISFKDRLVKSAQDARDQAVLLPEGREREHLLQKARQSETAINIDTWISTPGSRPPVDLGLSKKPKA